VAARTLKLSLLRPITRFKVFATKTAALAIGAAVLLLLLGVVTFLLSLVYGEAGAAGDTLKAYTASLLPMIAMGVAAVFLSQFFKSASGSLVFSIVLYAAIKAVPLFFPSFSAFSLVSYTDWHILWLTGTVPFAKLLSTFFVLVSSIVLFFSLGYYLFERKEV
jgi:ABC-2 type transport system permease protein